MPNLKWLLEPSWRMVVVWTAVMSGVISIAKDAVFSYLAARGHPIDAGSAWQIIGYTANAAFIVAAVVVLYLTVSRSEALEKDLATTRRELESAQKTVASPVSASLTSEDLSKLGAMLSSRPSEPHVPKAPRAYVKETATEILARLASLKWNEREPVANASYINRWMQGAGRVESVRPRHDGYSVMVRDHPPDDRPVYLMYSVFLDFPQSERDTVEQIQVGLDLRYKGIIDGIGESYLTLVDVELRLDTTH